MECCPYTWNTIPWPGRRQSRRPWAPRYLRLQEAIAMALEKGTASSNVLSADGLNGGIVDNSLPTNNRGLVNNQIDSILVLMFNPAIAYTTIEASESRFDPK